MNRKSSLKSKKYMQTPKYMRAIEYVGLGLPNLLIIRKLRDEFGTGVTTTHLRDIRARRTKEASVEGEAREAKRALCRTLLEQGASYSRVKRECRKKYGSGLGYNTIRKIRDEVQEAQQMAKTIEQVVLPTDILETSDPPSPVIAPPVIAPEPLALEPTAPEPASEPVAAIPEPGRLSKGLSDAREHLAALQQWMQNINAESLSLTSGGKLSVTIRHELDLGGI